MIDERSSTSILRKTILEPQTGIKPANLLITGMFDGFDPRLGLKNDRAGKRIILEQLLGENMGWCDIS